MPDESTHSHEDEVVSHEITGLIGTAILIGFVIMLIIDEATCAFSDSQSSRADKERNELIELKERLNESSIKEDKQALLSEERINSAFLTTIALCIHSLTEGVAMGASLFCKY